MVDLILLAEKVLDGYGLIFCDQQLRFSSA